MNTNRHADTRNEVFQLVTSKMTKRMVLPASRSALPLGTITNGNALIIPVYVKVPHCQCAQMFLGMFLSEYKSSGNGIAIPLPEDLYSLRNIPRNICAH